MFDIGGIIENLGSGVGVVDGVLKALKSVKDLTKKEGPENANISAIESRVADAYEQLVKMKELELSLLQAAIQLQAEKAALDKAKADIEKFQSKFGDYVLTELTPNSLAYALKPGARPDEPRHYMCARCFDDGQLSLLQRQKRDFHFDTLECQRCKGTVQCPNDVRMTILTGPVRRNDPWGDF